MEIRQSEPAIPPETALALCDEIRKHHRNKWYTLARWQCLGCDLFSSDPVTQMGFSGKPHFRGCELVNAIYDQRAKA